METLLPSILRRSRRKTGAPCPVLYIHVVPKSSLLSATALRLFCRFSNNTQYLRKYDMAERCIKGVLCVRSCGDKERG